MEQKIQTLASLGAKNFIAYLDEVSLRQGQISKRIFIDHPQAAAMIPFTAANEVIMVRQYRYALQRETLEIPAGKLDEGESPEECIKRELVEETGFEAQQVRWLYTYAPAIGYSNELIHIYEGRGLRRVQEEIDTHEISALEILPVGMVLEMIKNHEIVDSKTLLALAFTMSLV